jgi:hypothetical protein
MKRIRPLLLVLILFAAYITPSFACKFEGKEYPPGSIIGDRVCQADGTWRRTR